MPPEAPKFEHGEAVYDTLSREWGTIHAHQSDGYYGHRRWLVNFKKQGNVSIDEDFLRSVKEMITCKK